MKFFKILIFFLILIMVTFFTAASFYMKQYGQGFIEAAMKSGLKREVVLESAAYQIPFSIRLTGLRVSPTKKAGHEFRAREVRAEISLETLIRRKLIFDTVTLIEPFVAVEIINGATGLPDEPARRHGVIIPPVAKDTGGPSDAPADAAPGISVNRLLVKQGRFKYTNRSIDKDFSFTLEDVSLKAKHLAFPVAPVKTDFNVKGRLVKKGNPLSGSTLEGSGWVDLAGRDMEARMEVVESDGSVGMKATAVSKNNDMKVTGEIKFKNILMGAPKENEEASAVNELISGALSSSGVEIGARFAFTTKMDDFHPEQVSFSGNVVTR